jgi:hypothetical protein
MTWLSWYSGVCDQKTSKLFVCHREESMAGHMGVSGVYYKLRARNTKGSMVEPGGIWRESEHVSAIQVLLKPTLT